MRLLFAGSSSSYWNNMPREVAKRIAYEGGQHMVAFVKDQELVKQTSATMHACNRPPRMGDMYRRYYDEWAKIGGDAFAVFSSIGQYSNHGVWGLAEYYDSQPADYPKLAATAKAAKQWGNPWRQAFPILYP